MFTKGNRVVVTNPRSIYQGRAGTVQWDSANTMDVLLDGPSSVLISDRGKSGFEYEYRLDPEPFKCKLKPGDRVKIVSDSVSMGKTGVIDNAGGYYCDVDFGNGDVREFVRTSLAKLKEPESVVKKDNSGADTITMIHFACDDPAFFKSREDALAWIEENSLEADDILWVADISNISRVKEQTKFVAETVEDYTQVGIDPEE